MKSYTLRFAVTLIEGDPAAYTPKRALFVELSEPLPKNVDARRHIRARLAEEVERQFNSLAAPIENFEDAAVADPLEDDL